MKTIQLGNLLTSRTTAKANSHKHYLGALCVNGHIGIRYVNCNRCVDCMYKRYHHQISNATPGWVNDTEKEMIKQMTITARSISILTGEIHSVDHYYPLFGKRVSGLHTITNLCIIPHKENMKKKNIHPEEFYNEIMDS